MTVLLMTNEKVKNEMMTEILTNEGQWYCVLLILLMCETNDIIIEDIDDIINIDDNVKTMAIIVCVLMILLEIDSYYYWYYYWRCYYWILLILTVIIIIIIED